VRYLTRIVTPEDYDAAVRLRPETCPMYYMGDRRTGRQLLADFDADAAVSVAALASELARRGVEGGVEGGGSGGIVVSGSRIAGHVGGGYVQACGGRGLLEGIAAAVGGLAAVLAAAGPGGVGYEEWARAVRAVSAGLG
jgi:hypothetical protein